MKYKAVFLRKIGEYQNKSGMIRPNYVRVGEKKFSSLDETITFDKDNSYPVQLEAYSEQNKDTFIYYYDYDNMDLIGLETLLKYGIKPKDLNKITGKRVVEQIVAGAKSVQGNPLIYIIIPLLTTFAGLVIGYWMGGGFNAPTTV